MKRLPLPLALSSSGFCSLRSQPPVKLRWPRSWTFRSSVVPRRRRDAALDALERRASAGEVRLLHWRLDAEEGFSDFPNDDARLRAEALDIANGPAVAVNGQVLPDLEDDTLESALVRRRPSPHRV
ncbi:MAG: hypothetical protein CM15mP128_1820 [Methanobacteriota archaeon]|nr:MAG: hypothetical protein CM15mP128_1820 [Euryarchaeota archaeon]